MGNGGDLDGKRIKRRKERVGTVASNPDNLENSKEAGGGAQRTQSLSKDCTSKESVSPLSRLIRGFALSVIDPSWEDQCQWHRTARMAGPDCAAMCYLINTLTVGRPGGSVGNFEIF